MHEERQDVDKNVAVSTPSLTHLPMTIRFDVTFPLPATWGDPHLLPESI